MEYPGDVVALGATRGRDGPRKHAADPSCVHRIVSDAVVSAGSMATAAQKLSISVATILVARDMYRALEAAAREAGKDFVINSSVVQAVCDHVRAMYRDEDKEEDEDSTDSGEDENMPLDEDEDDDDDE